VGSFRFLRCNATWALFPHLPDLTRKTQEVTAQLNHVLQEIFQFLEEAWLAGILL